MVDLLSHVESNQGLVAYFDINLPNEHLMEQMRQSAPLVKLNQQVNLFIFQHSPLPVSTHHRPEIPPT